MACLQAFRLGHQGRQGLHGRTGFHEFQLRALDQQLWGDVDAHLLQLEGIQLRRQPGVHARHRQHTLPQPGGVGVGLGLQRGQRRFGAGLWVFNVERADAVDIRAGIGDGLFHLQTRGFQQVLALAFGITRLGLLEDRSALRPQADVALQTFKRLGPAHGGGLLLQQGLLAAKHLLGGVGPVAPVARRQRAAFDPQRGHVNHDLQVLAHVGVALGGQRRLQPGLGVAQGIPTTLADLGAEVGRQAVVLGQSGERGRLGCESGLGLHQQLGVLVAPCHPGRGRPGCAGSLWSIGLGVDVQGRCEHQRDSGCKKDALH